MKTVVVLLLILAAGAIAILLLRPNRPHCRLVVAKASADQQALSMAVSAYRFDSGRLPGRLEDLTNAVEGSESYLERDVPLDPWNRPYRYRVLSSNVYRIASDGPDGREGTRDDVVFQRD